MSTVLVTWPTVIRRSRRFFPGDGRNHRQYPRRDGQAELAWVAGYIQRWFTHFEDRHPSKYYPGPALINFVDATNDVTN